MIEPGGRPGFSSRMLGLYVHIPFCAGGKCPYCDFYSVPFDADLARRYRAALKERMEYWGEKARGREVDTVYFGGGTPSVLREGLAGILLEIKENFRVVPGAEITLEANPSADLASCFGTLAEAGFNRISLGMQSAVQRELDALGRRQTPGDAARAVEAAKASGIGNVSLDLMLCTPFQTLDSLAGTIGFLTSLRPAHVSAYLLSLERGTRFYSERNKLKLPDEDAQADFYLQACEQLGSAGYRQYEISNFAVPGFESRHNLKYWDSGEYIGIGPGAHSFFNGRRFYYKRDIRAFIEEGKTTDDGGGGGFEEYCMLRLRLSDGLAERDLRSRFGVGFEVFEPEKTERLRSAGYLETSGGVLRLTRKGFLVSNAVIAELIFLNKGIDIPQK